MKLGPMLGTPTVPRVESCPFVHPYLLPPFPPAQRLHNVNLWHGGWSSSLLLELIWHLLPASRFARLHAALTTDPTGIISLILDAPAGGQMSEEACASPWAGPSVDHFSKHPLALAQDLLTCRGRSQEASLIGLLPLTWDPVKSLNPLHSSQLPHQGLPAEAASSCLFATSSLNIHTIHSRLLHIFAQMSPFHNSYLELVLPLKITSPRLNEWSQTRKLTYYVIPFTWKIQHWDVCRDRKGTVASRDSEEGKCSASFWLIRRL